MVLRIIGVQRNIQQTSEGFCENLRQTADRRGIEHTTFANQAQTRRSGHSTFGYEHVAVGKKGHAPRMIEPFCDNHDVQLVLAFTNIKWTITKRSSPTSASTTPTLGSSSRSRASSRCRCCSTALGRSALRRCGGTTGTGLRRLYAYARAVDGKEKSHRESGKRQGDRETLRRRELHGR